MLDSNVSSAGNFVNSLLFTPVIIESFLSCLISLKLPRREVWSPKWWKAGMEKSALTVQGLGHEISLSQAASATCGGPSPKTESLIHFQKRALHSKLEM